MSLPPNHELEDRLSAAGKRLLQPPSALDELLTLLDRIEELLSKVAQSPPTSTQAVLSPLSEALISEELLNHSDVDVRVAVAACVSEITRITAPEAPYGDEQMKDVFQLIVSSFGNLSDISSRSFKKRATILETVAKVRSCVIMLDLELDQMIIEMFQHFLKSIRQHHEEAIFDSMSAIMTLVLEESEDISPDLLWPILDTLRKNNKEVLPIAKNLSERVIVNAADKLRPCLAKAVNTLNASLDDYNDVIASVCRKTNGSFGHSDENILKEQSAEGVQGLKNVGTMKTFSRDATAAKDVEEDIESQEKDPTLNRNGDEETRNDVILPLRINQQPMLAVLKQQFDAQSTTKTESDDMGAQKPAHLEVKTANCRNNSAESSDIIDDEKLGEIPSEEIHTLPDELPTVEAEKPLETEVSPVKETEVAAVNKASPLQKSSVADENRPKRAGRSKRKKTMVKEDSASRKASEGPNIGQVSKKQRTMKKQDNLTNNVDKAKNDADAMSDLEARCLDSGESNNKENRSLLKEDGRRGGRVKPKFEEETSKCSSGDNGENAEASLSPAKSAEDEVRQEETPRIDSKRKRASGKDNDEVSVEETPRIDSKRKRASGKDNDEVSVEETPRIDSKRKRASGKDNDEVSMDETPRIDSKRKRASGKDNTPRNIQYGKNLIGSKVKVLWPDDDVFYEGVIKSYDHIKKRHKVVYTDGDEEQLNLRKEEWEFVTDESALDGGKSAEHSGQGASSKKKKKGANSKTPNKPEKKDDPPKSKPKGSATKSGSKPKNDGKAKVESPANSEDGTDKSEDHSEEEKEVKSPVSSAKASGGSRPSNKKQAIQRPTNSKGKTPQSKKTAGKGTKVSSSSKVKETAAVEKKLDSVKPGDSAKGGKSGGSGNKSAKKRRK